MSDSRTRTYPSYRDDEPAMQRLAKCIAFELSAGGNAAAAAMAVMRDVRLGYINLPSPAWRDSIRAAVDAEREAERGAHQCDCPFGWCDGRCPTIQSRKALDALLADGGA